MRSYSILSIISLYFSSICLILRSYYYRFICYLLTNSYYSFSFYCCTFYCSSLTFCYRINCFCSKSSAILACYTYFFNFCYSMRRLYLYIFWRAYCYWINMFLSRFSSRYYFRSYKLGLYFYNELNFTLPYLPIFDVSLLNTLLRVNFY